MSRILNRAALFVVVILCASYLASPLSAQKSLRIPTVSTNAYSNNKQLRPLMRNGKPIFVIGAYGIPDNCNVFDLKSAGWNTVLTDIGPNLKQLLQDSEMAGIGLVPYISTMVSEKRTEEVRAFINEYKHYPAMFGYYIFDEPENFYNVNGYYKEAVKNRPGLTFDQYIKESIGWVRETTRELDPKHYTFMCIAWWNEYMNLQNLCDVNLPNSYPTNNTKKEFEGSQAEILYDAWLARDAAQAHGGLGFVYTPFGVDKKPGVETYRTPTNREFRYSVYAPITGGAMGIIYWSGYRCSKSYAQSVIFPVTVELKTLTPFFLGKWMDDKIKCEPSASTNDLLKKYKLPQINGCLRRAADGRYLLLAVNNTDTPVDAKFTINIKGLPRTCRDYLSRETVSINKGVISSTMSPYGVCAYIFSTKK